MASIFAIDAVEKELLKDGETTECKALIAGRNAFDAGDTNGHMLMDMPGGTSASGRCSMVIDGSLNGMPNNPCRVQVAGDLLIKGNVFHAQIQCKALYVDGDVQDSRVSTTGDAYIGGELMQTQLLLGDYGDRKSAIEDIYRGFSHVQNDLEEIGRAHV